MFAVQALAQLIERQIVVVEEIADKITMLLAERRLFRLAVWKRLTRASLSLS
jgi:hypothetical protein